MKLGEKRKVVWTAADDHICFLELDEEQDLAKNDVPGGETGEDHVIERLSAPLLSRDSVGIFFESQGGSETLEILILTKTLKLHRLSFQRRQTGKSL